MKTFSAKIIDPIGLHARPTSVIASEASKFKSDIVIVLDKTGKVGNLKSVMMVLSMNIRKNDLITIKANGEDEEEAINDLLKALKANNLIA
ncbi:Phosphocarrier protein of PTS system [Mycoplasmopsis meleagridis]|uniref:Phosphocarrier protein HPr n=1 Tax=Mycoplasmopsis meleagridis ATCC 25294 TaxID=1264554 RepID=A0A0F5H0E2_9BACT|nr:HPr family phosphocarrier protein [Mycoplasmopsis meleagridis]KKB26791.1 Phosphocarrier protein of PTS system [Mycoplasmopsis meleagridis ATCC 25294]KUH47265.1 phosphocarrier protein HPr [Mycoplasmopsis meleagridis]OAD18092.1 Phosphocarrier protein of PTS system [Mycoplasmopsis meleagridis]VEU77326.1 phosphocarrier protein HPr [Mycoplasmopsis meleagridis]